MITFWVRRTGWGQSNQKCPSVRGSILPLCLKPGLRI